MKLRLDKIIHSKVLVYSILVIVFCLLIYQHYHVFLYFDDYGNASLSYGVNIPGVEGTNWSISDLFTWMKWCYMNWGGRILYAALFLIPLTRFGALPFMMVQAAVITAIFWVMYRLICLYRDEEQNAVFEIVLIILYCLMGQQCHMYGTYWASASVLYIWPLLPLAASLYLHKVSTQKEARGESIGKSYVILQLFLCFFAVFSQEQMGVFLILYYAFDFILCLWREHTVRKKLDIVPLMICIVVYCFMFFAPGNFARLNTTDFSQLSFLQKIEMNLTPMFLTFFADGLRKTNYVLMLVFLFAAVKLGRVSRKGLILVFLNMIAVFLVVNGRKHWILLPGQDTVVLSAVVSYILVMVIWVITAFFFFIDVNQIGLLAAVIGGGASVGCLVMSPTIQIRSYTGYIFAVFLAIMFIAGDILKTVDNNMLLKTVVYVSMAVFGVFAVKNAGKIIRGYEKNYDALKYNDRILRDYNGEDRIILRKAPDNVHRGPMAYEEGFEYTHYWMKEYYNIPEEVELVWE